MSLASYIGCNVVLPTSEEESEDLFYVGCCFAGDEELDRVKKHQFSTPYVYEVSSHWGIEITDTKYKDTLQESKQKLLQLSKLMDSYLEKGDFFELYSCWVGEEGDPREGELTLQIHGFDVDQLHLPEKTLVRFVK